MDFVTIKTLGKGRIKAVRWQAIRSRECRGLIDLNMQPLQTEMKGEKRRPVWSGKER